MKATDFWQKLREFEKKVKDEIASLILSTGADRIEFIPASDESVDWCDKVTIDYTDDFTGEVNVHVVEAVNVVNGRLLVEMREPDCLDEVKAWGVELNIDSLISIHSAVCNKLGIEKTL